MVAVAFDSADMPTSARPSRLRALRPCRGSGCRKPAVMGESTCFDHIDPEVLEEANRDTDDEDPTESIEQRIQRLERETGHAEVRQKDEVEDLAKTDEAKLECPSCGREYSNKTRGPHDYALHIASCKGKPATSGRIAARGSRSSAPTEGPKAEPRRTARKRSAMPRKKASAKRVKRAVAPRATAVPKGTVEAIAWAITQKPSGWAAGTWLARLLPDGVWGDWEDEALADAIVGAAIRSRGAAAPA